MKTSKKLSMDSLQELLVKTSYPTQTTSPTDKDFKDPRAFGTGFIVEYQDEKFFVTADHTIHLDDYPEGGVDERTGNDYTLSVFTNYTPPGENFLSTILTPLGGFYHINQFNLKKPNEALKPVDIALCKMSELNLSSPFLCDDTKFAGQSKLPIKEECFSEPQEGKDYYICGHIKTRLDGIILNREKTIKCVRFNSKAGDYFLFNTPETITDYLDWEGLSGAPVISEDGDCVGVFCSANVNSTSVFVMPIEKIKMLIDIAAHQEKLAEK
jgi:hypothetical protein